MYFDLDSKIGLKRKTFQMGSIQAEANVKFKAVRKGKRIINYSDK